jgi:hypothetical protein
MLDDAAVEAIVMAVARHELDDALVALACVVRRETEGNPFFIGEVIRHLTESGALFQERGRWNYRGAIAGSGFPRGCARSSAGGSAGSRRRRAGCSAWRR